MCEIQRKGERAKGKGNRIRIFPFALSPFLFALFSVQAGLPQVEGELSDPTRPPDYRAAAAGIADAVAAPQWVLKSILISPGRRSAVLNGRAIKKGEQLDNQVTVLDILPGSVLLKGAEGEFSVNLLPTTVKMPVNSGSPVK